MRQSLGPWPSDRSQAHRIALKSQRYFFLLLQMRSPLELHEDLVKTDLELKRMIQEVRSCEDLEGLALKNREVSEAMHKMNRMIRDVECFADGATRTHREEMMDLVDTFRKVSLDNQVRNASE